MKYVHYGHSAFSKELFSPISNQPFWIKPIGGLWGSMPDSEYSWKARCIETDFHTEKLNQYFYFTVTPNARVLRIRKSSDLDPLPKFPGSEELRSTVFLDFEKLAEKFDLIEYYLYGDFELQSLLGAWDCDYVLVLNPEVVRELPRI